MLQSMLPWGQNLDLNNFARMEHYDWPKERSELVVLSRWPLR